MLTGLLISRFTSQKVVSFMTRLKQADLVTLGGLLESRMVTPVMDSRHRLSETCEAFRRLAEGHARGKIVVTVGQNGARRGLKDDAGLSHIDSPVAPPLQAVGRRRARRHVT